MRAAHSSRRRRPRGRTAPSAIRLAPARASRTWTPCRATSPSERGPPPSPRSARWRSPPRLSRAYPHGPSHWHGVPTGNGDLRASPAIGPSSISPAMRPCRAAPRSPRRPARGTGGGRPRRSCAGRLTLCAATAGMAAAAASGCGSDCARLAPWLPSCATPSDLPGSGQRPPRGLAPRRAAPSSLSDPAQRRGGTRGVWCGRLAAACKPRPGAAPRRGPAASRGPRPPFFLTSSAPGPEAPSPAARLCPSECCAADRAQTSPGPMSCATGSACCSSCPAPSTSPRCAAR
mmetsp:Transcript_10061/g.27097  ORF Transcript_10061/g.27097 Transcript_10061/m.27097 type:complete len:289 (-) Transcript_10061:700-1566(-)